MKIPQIKRMTSLTKVLAVITFTLFTLSPGAPAWADDNAAALKDRYDSLAPQLKSNAFHRPIYLNSEETLNTLKGDIYAVVDYPFATVNNAFNDPQQGPANWCELLILHLNTKYCHASSGSNGATITMDVGKKTEQDLSDTSQVQFNYRSVATNPNYFQVDLSAAKGPLSTKDYRIVLEAVDIGKQGTFLHLTYSYGFGMPGRVAMKTYLATVGSAKVGFSKDTDGSYVGGVRGLVERNTMRYYLAIDAFLGSLNTPVAKRANQRFATWFDTTEQYPRQLHELDRQDYLQMKKNEYQGQQTAQ
ncbi:MAG: NAD/FAD-utilizing enzyme apparently involved in cell division [uncultured Paraburkholderia sp.]|nr:MAG: NAD/FAD-utilizing enzyme apparently involved in cell division [uncultured Paraburkholderia sp.]CAH2945217.1 MAG: NAD/FAD-utilizing enzyme apparently involved in cell division [uncultured Paraburkholderia sp.]